MQNQRINITVNQSGMWKEGKKIERTEQVVKEYNNLRFWTKVGITAQENLCWEWLRGKDKDGYGLSCLNNKSMRANRVAYILNCEIDPGKLFVCHTCDNPSCCNPKHLFLGTNSDNQQDSAKKGRNAFPLGSHNVFNSKLKEEEVLEIKKLRAEGVKLKVIGDKFGISEAQVCRLYKGQRWQYLSQ